MLLPQFDLSEQNASAALVDWVQFVVSVPLSPGAFEMIPLLQVLPTQVVAAQPLSQILVPGIQAKLFQQVSVVQVVAAQELSAQTIVPGIQVRLFQQVPVVQVVLAQELSAQTLVPWTMAMLLLQVVVVQVLAAQPLSTGTGGVHPPENSAVLVPPPELEQLILYV